MKYLPEINHCKPNPDAYWCPKCRAHTQFSVHSSYDSHYGSWNHCFSCRHCKSSMFVPNVAISVKWAMFILSFACFIGGVTIPYDGSFLALGATGAFALLLAIAFWFNRPMKWSGFNSYQSGRSARTLKEQALNHRFQPTFYECESFDEWAEQFLTSDEVQRLKEKYRKAKKVQKAPEPECSTKTSKGKLVCLAIFCAIGLTTALLFIENRPMIIGLYDQWFHSD